MELVIRKTDKTWITNSSMICNNKFHKQKEKFLFSGSKSYQLILKFCENVFFSYFDCKFQFERSIYKYWLALSDSMPGGTFPVYLSIYIPYFRSKYKKNSNSEIRDNFFQSCYNGF